MSRADGNHAKGRCNGSRADRTRNGDRGDDTMPQDYHPVVGRPHAGDRGSSGVHDQSLRSGDHVTRSDRYGKDNPGPVADPETLGGSASGPGGSVFSRCDGSGESSTGHEGSSCSSGDALWDEGLASLTRQGLRRELPSPSFHPAGSAATGPLVLCSNDYLGLSCDPRLREAAVRALEQDGCGSTGSRLLSGNTRFHTELEEELAAFSGHKACLLFNSGYHANIGAIPAIAAKLDAILSDELNHASIIDGCRLSRAETITYRHCDPEHLDSLLKKASGLPRKLIITEGVFSMDGHVAPLGDLVKLARAHGALLMLDDAHGFGVLGEDGKGTAQEKGVADGVDVYLGTLGKALGAMGGFIVGSQALIDYLISTARAFLYSTALPPSICAAATQALRIVHSEPWRRQKLRSLSETLRRELEGRGLDIGGSESHIVPVIAGSGAVASELARSLQGRGYLTRAIRFPTVRKGSERIRLSLRSDFTEEALRGLAEALAEEAAHLGLCKVHSADSGHNRQTGEA